MGEELKDMNSCEAFMVERYDIIENQTLIEMKINLFQAGLW